MLRTFRNSVALVAAVTMLASPLAAQTAPETPVIPAPSAPSTVAPAPAAPQAAAPATALPSSLTDLGITDAHIGDRGRIQGKLPNGQSFRGMLDAQQQLRMIGVGPEGALPAEIVSRLVPDAVRSSPIFGEFVEIRGVGRGDQGVMLFGADAQGQGIRAGFSNDGTLQRFGRGEMDRPRLDRRGDDRDGRHDKRGDRKEMRHERGDGDRGPGGPRAPQDSVGPASTALDDAAIQSVLRDAGYTQPGTINRNGPRVEVDAVNPEGEPVTVTINSRGVVVRELAR